MKREELILQGMSDAQVVHARKLLDRELKRRSTNPPSRKSGRSGTHRVESASANGRQARTARKTA